MKWSLVLALVFGGIAAAQQPAAAPALNPNVLDQFQWQEDPDVNKSFYKSGAGDGLNLVYQGEGALQSTLRTVGPAVVSKITTTHYAIVGKIKYTNVAAGSYLEMWSYFAPEQPGGPESAYFSRTLADTGPMAKLEGTDDGHDFSLPFDATGAKTKLIRLVLNIHFGGPGRIDLSDVKLVQYPDTLSPSVPATSSFTGKTASIKPLYSESLLTRKRLDWTSFLLGMLSTCLLLSAGVGTKMALARWNQVRHARELRRIASLDT